LERNGNEKPGMSLYTTQHRKYFKIKYLKYSKFTIFGSPKVGEELSWIKKK